MIRTHSIRSLSGPSLLAALLVLCSLSASFGEGRTLKAKFIYDGPVPSPAKLDINKDVQVCGIHNLVDESLLVGPEGGVANVIIWLRTKGVQVAAEYDKNKSATVIYDNKNCRFEPHVLVMRTSQTLELRNSDPLSHNTNMAPLGLEAINPLLPTNGMVTYNFAKQPILPVQVACNIHPWMKGWIVVRDNPYAAVSKADGTLEIKDLPSGELEFQAWHEKSGYVPALDWGKKGIFKMNVKDGDNDLGTIKLSPSLFNK